MSETDVVVEGGLGEDEPEADGDNAMLVREGDIAADYLERLLDIADYDGDIDLDVENDRAVVAIIGTDLGAAGRFARRDARRAAGADQAGRAAEDRLAQPIDAGHQRTPQGAA